MTKRILRIIGTIDEQAFKEFSENLHILEMRETSPVIVELSSEGGIAYDALAFCGRIRNSPCDIIIKAYGLIASAAVIILAAGDQRLMAKEAWVMVHEDSDKLKGNVVELEKQSKHLRRLENQWCELLADLTKTPAVKWGQLHKATTYLNSKECLDLDLVDKII